MMRSVLLVLMILTCTSGMLHASDMFYSNIGSLLGQSSLCEKHFDRMRRPSEECGRFVRAVNEFFEDNPSAWASKRIGNGDSNQESHDIIESAV